MNAVQPSPSAPASTLGRFELLGELGQGGSGVVYRARLGTQEVALKVLRPDLTPSARERRSFLEEARHLANLTHPGVVRVLDVGELDDGRPYLAMELLDGVDLGRALKELSISESRALEIFAQLCDAVAALHERGLIHRDLKPENVFLCDDGARAVLLDFGIARSAHAPPSTTTQAGLQRGTPAYMAPERFFGARATELSDLYELTVILYVLLLGRLPWDHCFDAEARLNPLKPSELRPDFAVELEAVILKGLATNAELRYASIRELALAVHSVNANAEPRALDPAADAAAVAPAPSQRPTLGGARRRSMWLGAGLLALGLGSGVLAYSMTGEDADRGMADRRGPETGSRAAEDRKTEDRKTEDRGTEDRGTENRGTEDRGTEDRNTDRGSEVGSAVVAGPAGVTAARDRSVKVAAARPKASAGVSSSGLPWCEKWQDLYCNDAFRATEGGLRNKLCEATRRTVTQYQKLVPATRTEMNLECQRMYPAMKAAADERIRQHQTMQGPPSSGDTRPR